MNFKKIVTVDHAGLESWVQEEIRMFTEDFVVHTEDPKNEKEVIERAKDAEVLLVSWRTPITRRIIDQCPSLVYIGMCCSLYDERSANVDIAYARERGITVYGVRDYGDEGLVEFILSELIRLYHGFGEYQWSEKQEELTEKTLGIIGMGATGRMLASRANAFGMNVLYYSRTRKEEIESSNLQYRSLPNLLMEADIISTHLPKHTCILGEQEFMQFGNKKILINTSLEPTFRLDALRKWLADESNFCIMDRSAMGSAYEDLKVLDRAIYTDKVTGFTRQAEGRLSKKVLENLNRFRHDQSRS